MSKSKSKYKINYSPHSPLTVEEQKALIGIMEMVDRGETTWNEVKRLHKEYRENNGIKSA